MKIILAMLLIPLTLVLIASSRFFKKKLHELFKWFGYEPVVYAMMTNNVRGLFDLLSMDLNE